MHQSLKREFVNNNLVINTFDDLQPYYQKLLDFELTDNKTVWDWWVMRSELESIISEELAWRYIKMNANTNDIQLAERFNYFVTQIEPQISLITNKLDKKFYQPKVIDKINLGNLYTIVREVKKDIDIFREQNVDIEAEIQQLEQEYGIIASKMTVNYNNSELTLQKAANYLKSPNRNEREQVYLLIQNRRLADKQKLDELLDKLIDKRNKVAANAGFDNFMLYKFKELGRFDYGVEQTIEFHKSIAQVVKPLVAKIMEQRKQKLGLDTLKPWDLDVDLDLLPPLKPFNNADELIKKTILCFRDLDPEFGIYLNLMNKAGNLDLESRKAKAPGGFNYPLHESNMPFIFMNATGNLRDMVTMVHEGGHAVHAFLCAKQPLLGFKNTPSEIAELASMGMELITMDYWHHFFDNKNDLKRARLSHLYDVLTVLPWVATVDKFQHYLYSEPNHTHQQRGQAWLNIVNEFGCELVDYSGIENFKQNQWQKQLHIFEVPFYYIEYGMAQLGAIALWRNFKTNKQQALSDFKNALKLGYSQPIPQVYEAAGIKFDFSTGYIKQLIGFVNEQINIIEQS